ncbi:MAG: hypothetical protein Q4C75_03055 [Bergeyella zoohelcum]|nr:hypothetical protein [Bergeyella zoohelcum]
MKLKLVLVISLLSTGLFAQKKDNLKLGTFAGLEANVGLDFISMIRKDDDNKAYYDDKPLQGDFTYGLQAQLGYHFTNRLAFSTGLRYSYINPNFHLIYWNFHPYVFLGDPKDENFTYISANYSTQINRSVINNGRVLGLSIGKFDVIDDRISQKYWVGLDLHNVNLKDKGVFFNIGYGITFFSNKSL